MDPGIRGGDQNRTLHLERQRQSLLIHREGGAKPAIRLGSQLIRRGKLGAIPPPAQGLDQLNARHHLLHAKIYRRLLIVE